MIKQYMWQHIVPSAEIPGLVLDEAMARGKDKETHQRYAKYSMMTMIKQTMADLMTNAEMKVKAMATTSITVATTRTGLNICGFRYKPVHELTDKNMYWDVDGWADSRLSSGSWVRYGSENVKC